MRHKQIGLGFFVFFIFNLFAFNPSPKSVPAPNQGPGLYAQDVDLVKLKKEEEERKKKTKKSKYVITNETIDKIELPKKPYGFIKLGGKEAKEAAATAGGETGNQVETEGPINAGITSDVVASSAGAERDNKEYWQEQVKKLYADMDKTEADIKNDQWEFNQVNNMLQAEDIYERRLELQKRLDELKKSIPELKQKLNDLNKALEDLEDQARKLGVPAGWLRVDRAEPSPNQQAEQSDKTKKG